MGNRLDGKVINRLLNNGIKINIHKVNNSNLMSDII